MVLAVNDLLYLLDWFAGQEFQAGAHDREDRQVKVRADRDLLRMQRQLLGRLGVTSAESRCDNRDEYGARGTGTSGRTGLQAFHGSHHGHLAPCGRIGIMNVLMRWSRSEREIGLRRRPARGGAMSSFSFWLLRSRSRGQLVCRAARRSVQHHSDHSRANAGHGVRGVYVGNSRCRRTRGRRRWPRRSGSIRRYARRGFHRLKPLDTNSAELSCSSASNFLIAPANRSTALFVQLRPGIAVRCHNVLPIVALSTSFVACSARESAEPLLAADSVAIRATQTAYVSAWLRDDTTGVLATLDSAAVLLPPRQGAIVGHDKIRAFWWPRDGSRTKITAFDWAIDEIGGTSQIAYTRGMSSLAWTYDRDTVHRVASSRSTNLTVLRRGADGRWLITHQMWSPPLP